MKVSVIVVNWNRRDLLRACLKSLAGQTGAEVRNHRRRQWLDGWFRRDGGARIRRRLIRNRENRGFCVANNQGIEASTADFVALLNNDAEADPRWLQSLLEAFEGRPDFGMAASKILVWENPDDDRQSRPSDLSRRPESRPRQRRAGLRPVRSPRRSPLARRLRRHVSP